MKSDKQSTGALIAPFAFLGSAYDARLKEVYTTYATKDLLQNCKWFDIIFDEKSSEAFDPKYMHKLFEHRPVGRGLPLLSGKFR